MEDRDTQPLTNAIGCLRSVRSLIQGPALQDAVVTMYLFRDKLRGITRNTGDAQVLLKRLDEHLCLLGMESVRLQQLWDDGADGMSPNQRTQLLEAVWGTVEAIDDHCVVTLPPALH